MLEEHGSDSLPLVRGAHVGVADERDVLYVLETHDSGEDGVIVDAPKSDFPINLTLQIGERHVGRMQAVRGNDACIGTSAIVDDLEDVFEL